MKRCSVEKCPRRHHARGYCAKHYQQAKMAHEFSNDGLFEGDYKLLAHEMKTYKNGYADSHRPKWHRAVYGCGDG